MLSGIKKGDTHMIFTTEDPTPTLKLEAWPPHTRRPSFQHGAPLPKPPVVQPVMDAVTPQPVHPPPGAAVATARHHDPNPILSILVVMFFIGLSVGAIKLTSYLQRAEKNKGHVTPRNMPMKVIAIQ
jgi:hypothetical protein